MALVNFFTYLTFLQMCEYEIVFRFGNRWLSLLRTDPPIVKYRSCAGAGKQKEDYGSYDNIYIIYIPLNYNTFSGYFQ